MGLTDRASRIIAERGRAVTLQRETPGGSDGFGGTLPGTWTDYPATAATARYGEELAAIAGGLFEVGDLRLFMAADVAVTPEVDDRVIAEGETYRVVRVSPVGTAGVPHLYDMQVRRDPAA